MYDLDEGYGDLLYVPAIGAPSRVFVIMAATNTTNAKPAGYWSDFSNLKRELLIFIAGTGTPGFMPKQQTFRDTGRQDLLNAMRKHGGARVVARDLGLRMTTHRKPAGHWQVFANVEHELRDFIEKHGTPGVMPGQHQLLDAGRADLANAIKRSGGHYAVARQLGLEISHTSKPLGFWEDFANLERELRAFTRGQGRDGMMPTTTELIEAERYDLKYGIERNGGFREVAERLDLQTRSSMGAGDDEP